jgi:hypothetical protein
MFISVNLTFLFVMATWGNLPPHHVQKSLKIRILIVHLGWKNDGDFTNASGKIWIYTNQYWIRIRIQKAKSYGENQNTDITNTYTKIKNSILHFSALRITRSGGHKEMSSILADHNSASYMSPNAGVWGGGYCRASANEYSCAHGAQINFGDLTPYLTYARNKCKRINRSIAAIQT